MTKTFWIVFAIFAVCWYFIGFIAWRVQNDALKRGFGRNAANFWGVGTVFLPFIFIPLYAFFRIKAPGYVVEDIKPGQRTICPHCGEANKKDAELCRVCGKRIDIETPEIGLKQCPTCGAMNPANAEYCSKCEERISFKD